MKKVFLGLGIFLFILFCVSVFVLKVKSVSCVDQTNAECPSPIKSRLNEFVGKRLFNAEKNIRNQLSQDSQILSFTVSVSPLGNISVQIVLRDPSIAFKPQSSERYTLYTKDGVVVREAEQTNLPIVTLKEQLSSKEITFLASFTYELQKALPVGAFDVSGSKLMVTLRDQRILYYPLSGDIDLLLGSTLATFSQLNQSDGKLMINGKAVTIHEIDFRFKNPVLR